MKLTQTPPTQPGHYWYRNDLNSNLEVVKIEFAPNPFSAVEASKELQVRTGEGQDDIKSIQNYGGWWARIDEPEDPPVQDELFPAEETTGKFNHLIYEAIAEANRAAAKSPFWPEDPFHAMAILQEEAGEASRELNQWVYEPEKCTNGSKGIRTKVVQTAAMALRWLLGWEFGYDYTQSTQNRQ